MAERDRPLPAWRCDESLRPMDERLAATAARPRVVSFDFFDTLILRLCAEPSDLFVEVGRQLAGAGLLRTPLTPGQFRSVRMMAEEKAREAVARSGRCPEVKLADIYAELRDVVTDPATARDLEFRIERGVCFLNPAMASLVEHVRALGCRTAIVSDSYFTAAELRQLLADQGMPAELFDAVLVSCERGKAKWWNGTLYQDLLKHFDIHPGEALHIGDNLNTDVRRARRAGIDTIHYYRTTPALSAAFAGEQKLAGYGEPRTGSLEALRVLSFRQAEAKDDAFRDGALSLGPVLARFADWCVEQYARAGVRRVLSLMREGELLGELVRRSAAAAGVELEVVTCFASRMATARAAMSTVTVESAAALLEGSQQLAPQGILEILGLAQEGAQFLAAETREKPLPSPEAGVQFLSALFGLPSLRRQIEARQRESFELAFEYLSSLIGDATEVGVLDLGWSGSIQRNIARIMRLGGRPVRTVGRYLACTRRAGRLALEGHEALAYLDSNWNRSAILPEVCITACVGSTTGYARDAGGKVVPVLDADAPSAEQVAIKGRVRAGVLAFQELWLRVRRRQEALGLAPELVADMDRLSPAILYRWMDFPTKPEADRLGALHHDENYFGRINSALLCDEESRRRFRRDGAQALFFDSRCYWAQGVMAQVYPRFVELVRRGWDDPLAAGRFGAWNGISESDAGLTADELVSLRELLGLLKAGQIVFCGSFAPALISLLKNDARGPIVTAEGTYPRLIVVGPAVSDLAAYPEARDLCQVVRGDLQTAATVATVRDLLCPDVNVALVLSGDVSAPEVSPVLQGLTPFLGKSGSILAACGRYEYGSVQNESAEVSSLRDWCTTTADEMGFGIWNGGPGTKVHLSNWIVLLHAPEEMTWSGQWMGIPEDLDHRREGPPAPAPAEVDRPFADAPMTGAAAADP